MSLSRGVAVLTSFAATAFAVAPSCDFKKPPAEVCEAYCNYECGFHMEGEDGAVQNKTIWRLSPANLTGLMNKNSADPPGDISFYFEKVSTQGLCAQYPSFPMCVGGVGENDLYGQYVLEIDGQLGPYQECNPTFMNPGSPKNWTDVQNYQCGQNCFNPLLEGGCEAVVPPQFKKNGTEAFKYLGDHPLAYNCFCDTTKRDQRAVGRERRLASFNQSNLSIAWRNLGGNWYSTPVAGQCPAGKPVGTNGCTWRVLEDFYKSAPCVNGKVADTVEAHVPECFNACPQPSNHTTPCYYGCYKLALEGDAKRGVKPLTTEAIVTPWLNAFKVDDPKHGGCPKITPPRCHGAQCDPLVLPHSAESLMSSIVV